MHWALVQTKCCTDAPQYSSRSMKHKRAPHESLVIGSSVGLLTGCSEAKQNRSCWLTPLYDQFGMGPELCFRATMRINYLSGWINREIRSEEHTSELQSRVD